MGIETAPAKKEVVEPKQKISQSTKVGRKYSYEILYSFEDAKKYKQYTEPGAWCITYGKQHYDGYIKRLKIHYVIFKRNGFENIPRKKGKNWTKMKPQDEYGKFILHQDGIMVAQVIIVYVRLTMHIRKKNFLLSLVVMMLHYREHLNNGKRNQKN